MDFWMFTRPEINHPAKSRIGEKCLSGASSALFFATANQKTKLIATYAESEASIQTHSWQIIIAHYHPKPVLADACQTFPKPFTLKNNPG
ncbi:hypothetical protein MASR1M36_17880 [Candidatus Cloacimonadaceae bacterium]